MKERRKPVNRIQVVIAWIAITMLVLAHLISLGSQVLVFLYPSYYDPSLRIHSEQFWMLHVFVLGVLLSQNLWRFPQFVSKWFKNGDDSTNNQ